MSSSWDEFRVMSCRYLGSQYALGMLMRSFSVVSFSRSLAHGWLLYHTVHSEHEAPACSPIMYLSDAKLKNPTDWISMCDVVVQTGYKLN